MKTPSTHQRSLRRSNWRFGKFLPVTAVGLALATNGLAADRNWEGAVSNVWTGENFVEDFTTNSNNGAVFYSGSPANLSPSIASVTTAYMIFNSNADSNMAFSVATALRLQSGVATSAAGSGLQPVGDGAILVDAGAAGTFSISGNQILVGASSQAGARNYLFTNNAAGSFAISAPMRGDLAAASGSTRTMQFSGAGSWAISGGITEVAGDSVTTFTAPITVSKSGNGTLMLSGTNTYTGATNVTGGTLLLNGSISSAQATTVGAGSVLGGTGSITGAGTLTTISGSIRPGTVGIGTLNVERDVLWNSNDAWVFDLGTAGVGMLSAGTSDLLNIAGAGNDFLRGSGALWSFDFNGTGQEGWYKLVDWTGATDFLGSNFTASGLASGLTGSFTIDASTSALYLEVTAIPEPASFAMIIGGLGVMLLLRRVRRTV